MRTLPFGLIPLSCLLSLLLLGGCSGPPAESCGPATCPLGCCDPAGVCRPGFQPEACGSHGGLCDGCGADELCSGGACVWRAVERLDGGGQDGGGSDGGTSLDAGSGGDGGTDCRLQGCPNTHYCELGSGKCLEGCVVDTQCPQPGFCDLGQNKCRCQSGTHACGNTCASNQSPLSCGPTSCTPCPAAPNGKPSCDGFKCGIECNPGFQFCAGACAPCQGAHAASFGCSGGQCVVTACTSGFHLCNGVCKANNDATACGASCQVCSTPGGNVEPTCAQNRCSLKCKSGTSICKGQCAAGACAWSAHSVQTPVDFLSVEVDDFGVLHAASVFEGRPSYHRLGGTGGLSTELVRNTSQCFFGPYYASTAPVLVPDPARGKAVIACVQGIMLDGYWWNGTVWADREVMAANSFQASFDFLHRTGNTVAFYLYHPASPYFRVYTSTWSENWGPDWTSAAQVASLSGPPLGVFALSEHQVAWVMQSSSGQLELTLAEQKSGSSGYTLQTSSLTFLPWAMALSASGEVLAMTDDLELYTLKGNQWSSESIASGTADSVDLVVDGTGTVRAAWAASSGVKLATRLGTTWTVETVSALDAQAVDLSVNASGKVVLGVVHTGTGFTLYQ